LAFFAGGYGSALGIYTYDTWHETYLRVVEAQWVWDLEWTLDGQSIVYQDFQALYRVPAAGGAPVSLGVTGIQPTCGPDDAVAYARAGDLWILSSDGQERRLTNTPAHEASPAWSPDGRWIAFESDRDGSTDIWITATTGGTAVRVTEGPAQDHQPSWSGDSRLVFWRFNAINDEDIWMATDLPDWTIPVESRSWSAMKQLFK
jgi:Tol biopolymer transport system component